MKKILLFILISSTILFAQNWEKQIIGSGSEAVIAVDMDGNPHICGNIDDQFKYGYWNGIGWVYLTIPYSSVRHYDMVLDGNKIPHIVYVYGNTIYYITLVGENWVRSIISTNSQLDHYKPKIAIFWENSQNKYIPHVVFANSNPTGSPFFTTGSSYIYAFLTSAGTWIKNTIVGHSVLTSEFKGLFLDLAIDAKGKLYVCYYDPKHRSINFAFYNGTAWSTIEVDGGNTEIDVGKYCSISIKKTSGTPHISYYDATNKWLKHATVAILIPGN